MIITVPEALRDKLGPEGAKALADLLNETSVRTRENVIEVAVDRFERRLAEELRKLRADMGAFESRITRWMFVFWTEVLSVPPGRRLLPISAAVA